MSEDKRLWPKVNEGVKRKGGINPGPKGPPPLPPKGQGDPEHNRTHASMEGNLNLDNDHEVVTECLLQDAGVSPQETAHLGVKMALRYLHQNRFLDLQDIRDEFRCISTTSVGGERIGCDLPINHQGDHVHNSGGENDTVITWRNREEEQYEDQGNTESEQA